MEMNLKCKDFDAWVSFLGRLEKIGSEFIMINDILFPAVKGTKSGSDDVIPGKHFVKDPLFCYDSEAYIEDAMYVMTNHISEFRESFKLLKETNKDARKNITYIRQKDGIYIDFSNGLNFCIFKLADEDDINRYAECRNILPVKFFDDFTTNEEWCNISNENLIGMRNDELMIVKQPIDDKVAWCRIARSIFTQMVGVTRVGSPLAKKSRYTFERTPVDDIALFKLHSIYNSPANSNIVKVECIHEYPILIMEEVNMDE